MNHNQIIPSIEFRRVVKLKIFNATQINAAGGIDAFSKKISNDQPISVPAIEFTEEEWEEITSTLRLLDQ